MSVPILAPVIALVLWSFVMWAWLYATRLPAMIRNKVRYDPLELPSAFSAQLPPQVRWKADNYNHLMEQPTLFYAVVLTLALTNPDNGVAVALAWSYVALRVMHSLVQAIFNRVIPRFAIFMASSVVLLVLALMAAAAVF